MLLIIQCVIRFYEINRGSIQIGLDGEKAMIQARGNFPLCSKQRSFMLVDIRNKIKLLPITVTFFWAERYQLQRHGRQSYMGELNNKYDYLANIY